MKLSIYIRACLFAILYGWMEQYMFRLGLDIPLDLPGGFSTYHVGMVGLWILVCFPYLQLVPLMGLLEDASFFFFHPESTLNPDSWVNFGMGGFHLFHLWVPLTYLILLFAYLSSEGLAYWLSTKKLIK